MAALADGADEAVPADHDPVDPAGEALVMAAVAFDAQVRVGVAGDERGKALRTASICRVGPGVDWENFERVFLSTFHEAGGNAHPGGCCVIVTEAPLTPAAQRNRIVSMLFDRCENVSSVLVAVDAVLAIHALRGGPGSSNPSGLAVTCTESAMYAAPVVEGVYVHSAVVRTHLGLDMLARYFTELARAQVRKTDPEAYKVFWENVDLSRSRDMLKSACFVALDYEKDYATYDDEGPCGLPQYFGEDGSRVSLRLTSAETQRNPLGIVLLDQAHFQVCEALFQPDLLTSGVAGAAAAAAAAAVAAAAPAGDADHHLPPTGIVAVVMKAIQKLPVDQQDLMFSNICLLGQGTMLQNLKERLQRDVARVVPDRTVIVFDLKGCAQELPYIGACRLQLYHPEAVRMRAMTREAYEKAPLCKNAAFRELQCTVLGRRSEHMTEIPGMSKHAEN